MATSATAGLELDLILNRWADGSAAMDAEALNIFSTTLGSLFGVKADEVAVLRLAKQEKCLHFILPTQLRGIGTIPLSSSSALAARTARERKPEVLNAFAGARHASVFEGVPMGRRADEAIQKIMSAPVMSGSEVLGVVQISRKGRSQKEAGPDFSRGNLKALAELMPTIARFVELSKKS
jgi:hypothetical protein